MSPTAHAARSHVLGLTLAAGMAAWLGNAVAQTADATLPPVKVTATAETAPGQPPAPYAGGQVARGARLGALGNTDVMDAPFNITSYTAEAIQNRSASSLIDILISDPGVRSGNVSSYDTFTIRGMFIGSGDTAFDGIYGVVSDSTSRLEGLERVEVLKGPATFVNGLGPSGSVGGVINLVPKRAGAEPLTRFTTTFSSRGSGGGHLDVGRRFGEDKAIGLRVNAAYTDGDTERKGEDRTLSNLTMALDYNKAGNRLFLDVGRYSDDYSPGNFANNFNFTQGVPKAPDASRMYGQSWAFEKRDGTFGVLRAEHDFAPGTTLGAVVSASEQTRKNLRMAPGKNLDLNGNVTTAFLANGFNDSNRQNSVQAYFRHKFETGAVDHTVNVSVLQNRINYGNSTVPSLPGSYSFNIYGPVPVLARPNFDTSQLNNPVWGQYATYSGLAVSDTLGLFDERLLVTIGARRQNIKDPNADYSTGTVSPAFGVVFKATPQWSIYANAVQGLQPGYRVSGDYQNAGEVFPAFKAKQFELGTKVDFGTFGATMALFQIKQSSVLDDNSTTPLPTQRLAGEQRNRGFELQGYGQITRQVRFLGGVSYIQPILTKTQDGQYDGNDANNAPRRLASLGLEWDTPFVPGLTLSGQMIHTGTLYFDAANRFRVPSWTRFDLGARFATKAFDRPLVLRLNVNNVAGRDYWNNGAIGDPRTVRVSATMDF